MTIHCLKYDIPFFINKYEKFRYIFIFNLLCFRFFNEINLKYGMLTAAALCD